MEIQGTQQVQKLTLSHIDELGNPVYTQVNMVQANNRVPNKHLGFNIGLINERPCPTKS